MAADGSISCGASAASAGLVYSKTSDTGSRLVLEIDRDSSRARRLQKAIKTGARLHVEEANETGFRGRWALLTCTYRDGECASPRDISRLLKSLRMHFNRACARRYGSGGPRFRYEWVLELTKRLRPHYHLLLWMPKGIRFPKPDAAGWWTHGLTKIEWARNAVGYLAKYASKFTSAVAHALPKGFRTHAVGGLNPEGKRELRWWKSPTAARDALGPAADIRKAKGGYFDRRTGEFWPSPWHVFITRTGQIFCWREA